MKNTDHQIVQKNSAKAVEVVSDNEFNQVEIVRQLQHIMTKVTEKEINPQTVHAACNAADKIVDMLRVCLEYKRFQRKAIKDE